jgi:myo-inositol-1(or 4)-monophosphatase
MIYDPNRNELFTASRGKGAFLNDRRIRVGKRTYLATGNLVAGSPKIFGQLLPIIQSHCSEALKA